MTTLFSDLASVAANTAWRESQWAVGHLQPHAGKTLRIDWMPPFAAAGARPLASLAMRVTAEGTWESVADSAETPAEATLRMTPTTGLALAQLPDKPGAALDLSGDPDFVAAVRDVHDVLPLAVEDRLSSIVGPIAAHAMMTTMRSLARWPKAAAGRLDSGASSWVTEERRAFVGRAAFDGFARDVAALAERVARLEDPSGSTGRG